MKNLDLEIKIIKIIFRAISIGIIIIGLVFSYLIAEFDDAPGMIFIGPIFTFACASFVYGISEMIIGFKRNNAILSDVYNELKKINK